MALTQFFPIITVQAAGAANTVLTFQGQQVIADARAVERTRPARPGKGNVPREGSAAGINGRMLR